MNSQNTWYQIVNDTSYKLRLGTALFEQSENDTLKHTKVPSKTIKRGK